MRNNLIVLFFIFISVTTYSQTTITGSIKDTSKTNIPYANIVLSSQDSLIVAYTFSNEKGLYALKTKKKGLFNLRFSAMGFKTVIIPIEITEKAKSLVKSVVLKEKSFTLNEVIVQANRPITVKRDTVVFIANAFKKGNEQVVEDLLKNIPGLSVDSKGTIKVNNTEVEKVMVEGDDFFDKGYKILTKNMPVNPIEKIEVLKHYSNNKLLKGIEQSDKVALNLILKEDAKRQWFGNFEMTYDVSLKNYYEFKSNLMNFGKKNKYYFLTNFNNIGSDATGDIYQLIHPFHFNEPGSIGDDQTANSLLNLDGYTPNFKASRTNFNNAELLSLNAIFKPNKKLKIKPLAFFNWDENDFFRNSVQSFNIEGTSFTNTEDFKLRKKRFTGFGKIDVSYDISKTKTLKIISKYNNQHDKSGSQLLFNGDPTQENLKTNNELFDQKVTYTHKFKKHKVFLLTGRYINEKTPQTYTLNKFFYQDLFPTISNANNVAQLSKNKMQFAGFDAHLMDRKQNGNLLELQFGNKYRNDKLFSNFLIKQENTVLEKPVAYQNNTTYTTNNMYFKSKYRLKIKQVAFIGKLDFNQLYNSLKQEDVKKQQQPFFINPSIGFDWEINKKNKIITSYAVNTTNAKILDVYSNYVLTGFRSFNKGTGGFNQLNASSLTLNYQLGNWSDKFFANTFVFYNKNHDFFSTNSFVTQNYSQSDKILIKDREMLLVSSTIDRYFKTISSNLKLKFGYSKSNYKNSVNSAALREVTVINYNYGLSLRSGFRGVFNYDIGTKWTTNQIKTSFSNTFTDNMSYLDLSFVFNDKFDAQLQTERYFFGNLERDNTYYFMDLTANYKPKKSKLSLALSVKNLFNTSQFKNYSISDISTSTTVYRLLPRYMLLSLKYRF
jgi:hypothetical protein